MSRAYDQLMATGCKYHNIPDLCRMIDSYLFAHPASCLVKALAFEYMPEEERGDVYKPARLCVRSRGDGSYARTFRLQDLGESSYDVYQIESDCASGIQLGRVGGTSRWGHER